VQRSANEMTMDALTKMSEHFLKACETKDRAIRSLDDLEQYQAAAQEFDAAAVEAQRAAETLEIADPKTAADARTYAHYYLYEHDECLASYHYENRDVGPARQYHLTAAEHLRKAIGGAEERAKSRDGETEQKFRKHLNVWRYMERSDQAKLSATDARGAWDAKDFITALDHYKRASRIEKECIALATQGDLDPRYIRISQGNYIGMMANASSALAMFFINTGTGPDKALGTDTCCLLVGAALDAYELGTQATYANPEWKQYRQLAGVCRDNIAKLLEDNPGVWALLLGRLCNDPRLEAIMKEVDPNKASSILAHTRQIDPKIVRLWAVGTLWILLIVIATLLVLLMASQDFGLLRFALAIVGVEVLIVLSGAFILRSIGDLSEASFVSLVRLALTKQVQMIKRLPSRRKEEEEAEPQN
jgi:hypothetical protein